MKLLEIIDTKELPTKQYKGAFKTPRGMDSERPGAKKRLGSGLFSTVKKSNDPHTVTKYRHNFGENDLYWDYANIIIRNKLWENPYFPRFYSKQHYVDKNDNKLFKYEMENLHEVRNISVEESIALINKMFGDDKSLEKVLATDEDDAMENIRLMIRLLNEVFAGSDIATIFPIKISIQDSQLNRALQILKKIAGHFGTSTSRLQDLHPGNVMIRRGPGGAQIVFTDPFSFKKRDAQSKDLSFDIPDELDD